MFDVANRAINLFVFFIITYFFSFVHTFFGISKQKENHNHPSNGWYAQELKALVLPHKHLKPVAFAAFYVRIAAVCVFCASFSNA